MQHQFHATLRIWNKRILARVCILHFDGCHRFRGCSRSRCPQAPRFLVNTRPHRAGGVLVHTGGSFDGGPTALFRWDGQARLHCWDALPPVPKKASVKKARQVLFGAHCASLTLKLNPVARFSADSNSRCASFLFRPAGWAVARVG